MNKSIKKEVYSFIMKEIKNPFWRTAAEYGTLSLIHISEPTRPY